MKRPRFVHVLAAGALALPACGDEPAPAAPPAPVVAPHPVAARPAAGTPGATADTRPAPPPMTITDQTFVESQMVRDPFRSFARDFVSDIAMRIQDTRDVKLPRYSLDDLRLVAVIVGTDSPYGMVVDPSHSGTILRRGMYVGRQEIIHSNIEGSQDYAVHWRVARIEPVRLRRAADATLEEIPAQVVFERPDPLNPNAQVVERTLALAPPQNTASGGGSSGALPPAVGVLPPGQASSGNAYLPPGLSSVGAGTFGQPGMNPNAPGPQPGPPGTTTVYNYTVPAQPAPAPSPTTVVVQAPPPAQPVFPPNTAPPVQVNAGPPAGAMPSHGLGQ